MEGSEEEVKAALSALHWRGTREVFRAAERLCGSDEAHERVVGADILGELGMPQRTFPDDSVRVLLAMLERENDPEVLQSVAIALGHQQDVRAVEPLLRFKDHPSAEVRYGVVYGLHGHEDERAVEALIALSADPDDDVRDWATFALGSLALDTIPIRHALLARLGDRHDAARGEALLGLAVRGDERVLEPLLAELARPAVSGLAVEAAGELRNERLRPALQALRGRWEGSVALLDEAIRRCGEGERRE